MNTEKILKRDDGSRVKIMVSAWENHGGLEYNVSIYTRAKGKRRFHEVRLLDWKYRSLDIDERRKVRYSLFLTYVTEQEIQDVCEQLWNKIKPEFGKYNIGVKYV